MRKRQLRLDKEVLTWTDTPASVTGGSEDDDTVVLLYSLLSRWYWACLSIAVSQVAGCTNGCTGGTGTATCQCTVSNQASSPCC